MTAATFHAAFAAAITDAGLPPPENLRVRAGDEVARCFAVHRNNAIVSLTDALEERFPVTARLVGTDFFRAMARAFIAAAPPRSAVLATYGDALPDFIAAFPPAAPVSYLADVARLEAARTRAYHAADVTSLPWDALAGWEDARLAAARLVLHPSVEALSSPFAVATIWGAHQADEVPEGLDPAVAEDVLVARPRATVEVRPLPPGGAAFVTALGADAVLAEAAAFATASVPDFDAASTLATVISTEVIVAVEEEGGESP